MPLAGRPFLSYMLDWLRAPRGGRRGDLVRFHVRRRCGACSATSIRACGCGTWWRRSRWAPPAPSGWPTTRESSRIGWCRQRRRAHRPRPVREIAWHEEAGARATLGLVKVADTASYGVVPTDAAGRVEEFLEKSDEASPHGINAGFYVLGRSVVEGIPAGRPCPSSARCSRRWWARACLRLPGR